MLGTHGHPFVQIPLPPQKKIDRIKQRGYDSVGRVHDEQSPSSVLMRMDGSGLDLGEVQGVFQLFLGVLALCAAVYCSLSKVTTFFLQKLSLYSESTVRYFPLSKKKRKFNMCM